MIVFIFFSLFYNAGAVIYRLNESELALFPKLMHLDSFEECQKDAHAVYCTADFSLVSDEPSPLLDMIQEYSEYTTGHYNRTILHYGICLTQTCAKFYEEGHRDLASPLEACLNESISNKHQLKVKVLQLYGCRHPGKPPREVDQVDLIVGIVCIIILIANAVGSLCDYFFDRSKANKVFRLLLCFSIQYNWRKLTALASRGRDPRLIRLRAFHGIRVINATLVILAHCLVCSLILIDNPEFIEETYQQWPYHIILNGNLIMQTFLILSAFLLVYLSLIDQEKRPVSWSLLPKYVLFRWLRLTPVYVVMLALTATWLGHISSGPLWNQFVEREMLDCRQHWWQHILYINTFFNDSECFVQSWYLATDMQLYILAVVVYLACRTTRSRVIVLTSLMAAGVIIPAVVVYIKDLDGVFLNTPEVILGLFFRDPNFINTYSKSYTNIFGYMLGMALGYLVYHWQQQGVNFRRYQPLPRIMMWSALPLGVACMATGGIFFAEGPRQSTLVSMAFAAFMKPIFGLIICGLLIGLIFRFEDTYRGILEWRHWVTLSRVSYSAYLVHACIMRNYLALLTETSEQSVWNTLNYVVIMVVVCFLAAYVLYLLVEAPFNNIFKECLPNVEQYKKETEEKKNGKEHKTFKRSNGFKT
ncbi:nose resistant to fluoxetine protein 6-like [Anticarsia gemmatalis]|uniref:nose resistant to fluoxetine protein 6-like n=1 Tax=Anticarsia gemmatalis TaxID=129554 RepID=UPI003F75D8F3